MFCAALFDMISYRRTFGRRKLREGTKNRRRKGDAAMRKKNRTSALRRILTSLVCAAALAAGGFFSVLSVRGIRSEAPSPPLRPQAPSLSSIRPSPSRRRRTHWRRLTASARTRTENPFLPLPPKPRQAPQPAIVPTGPAGPAARPSSKARRPTSRPTGPRPAATGARAVCRATKAFPRSSSRRDSGRVRPPTTTERAFSATLCAVPGGC